MELAPTCAPTSFTCGFIPWRGMYKLHEGFLWTGCKYNTWYAQDPKFSDESSPTVRLEFIWYKNPSFPFIFTSASLQTSQCSSLSSAQHRMKHFTSKKREVEDERSVFTVTPLLPGSEGRAKWPRALEPGQPALWETRRRWRPSRRRSSLAAPPLASPGPRRRLRLGTERCAATGRRPGRVRAPAERRAEPEWDCWCGEGSSLREMAYDFLLEKKKTLSKESLNVEMQLKFCIKPLFYVISCSADIPAVQMFLHSDTYCSGGERQVSSVRARINDTANH